MADGAKTELTRKSPVVPKKSTFLYFGAAAVLCLLLYGWFAYAVRLGIGRYDEAFYMTLPQRISLGDRFILHEWFFSQFSAIFQYLHYILFVKSVGSTEGIILHMRYTYLVINFLVYWVIIYHLRKTPLRALTGAFLFCGFVPFAIFAPNYYNLTPFICLLICFVLTGKRGRLYAVKLFLCGVLLSIAVLLAPTLSLLYVLYSVFVFIYHLRQRKGKQVFAAYAFLLDLHVWGALTVGVAVCAAVFLPYIGLTCGFGNVIKMFPYLLANSEYFDASVNRNLITSFFDRIFRGINMFHPVNVVFAVLLILGAVYVNKNKEKIKNTFYWKTAILVVSFVIFISSCTYATVLKIKNPQGLVHWWYHSFCVFPLFFLCLICCFLCSDRDPKKDLFWQTGFFLALFRDFFSNVSLGIGCILCVIPLPFFFAQVSAELRGQFRTVRSDAKLENKRRKMKKVFSSIVVLTTVFVLCWNTFNIYAEGTHLFVEKLFQSDVEVQLTEGPYKGIYTGKKQKEAYDAIVSDLKQIEAMTEPEDAVYVTDLCPLFYLYLARPYSAYSSWFVGEDLLTRQMSYWQMYPEKLPSVIYVPRYTLFYESNIGAEYFQMIEQYFTYDSIHGNGGEILVVKDCTL